MEEEKVILVDENDKEIGLAGKLEAHEKGLLHRAFSVFVFNSKGELMLQQRAAHKYHSPNLWTNTCCSHPRYGEGIAEAAKRRLKEEMGIACTPKPLFSFIYKVDFENGLTEHELDHVLYCINDSAPNPDPEEVQSWAWVKPEILLKDIQDKPTKYTYWFGFIFQRLMKEMKSITDENPM